MAVLTDLTTMDWTILRNPPPTIEGGPQGRRASMSLLIALNDLPAFAAFAAGQVELIDMGGGTTIERIVPMLYPDDVALQLIGYRAEACGSPSTTAIGDSVHTRQFSHYKVACEFQTLPFDVNGDAAYYSLSTEASETFEVIPSRTFLFPDSTTLTGEYGLPVVTVTLVLTTFMSPTPISYTMAAMTGKVNSAVFEGYPIGTLRFTGVASEYSEGMFTRSLIKRYTLKFREKPWNQVLSNAGTWQTPTLGGTGLTKYASADFSVLLTM